MTIHGLDHCTLVLHPADLECVRGFYCDVIGLSVGHRPAFDFPGYWLYAQGKPIVHLAATALERLSEMASTVNGRLDHVSLRTSGLAAARVRLERSEVTWAEQSVPGDAVHQMFVQDPTGLKIELTFAAAELVEAGPRQGAASR